MRITAHDILDVKGTNLANTEVDNNFIVLYETLKGIYLASGVAAYAGGTTYAKNNIVIYDDIVYLSLQNANTDNTPGIVGSETWWGLASIGDMLNVMFNPETSLPGISAGGAAQGNATIITKKRNRIDTVPAGTGVVNDIAETIGFMRTVQNNGANDLLWYPFLGSNFLGQAANIPILIAAGNQATVFCYNNRELTLI